MRLHVAHGQQFATSHLSRLESHAVADKPCDAECFCVHPMTLLLLLFYIHCTKADVNVKL